MYRKTFILKTFSLIFAAIYVLMIYGPVFAQIPFRSFQPFISSPDVPVLKGVRIDSRQPFRFEFFVNQGQREETQEVLKDETRRLVEYFLASLAVPEKDLWVNLSPYEKDRIIPAELGLTSMGKELLSQDYVLKQATAGLIHPDKGTGQVFWQKVYARARDMYGTTDIPFDFSNKVWIVPERAVVYERFEEGKAVAYVVEARLKVMSESDYVAAQEYMDAADSQGREGRSKTQDLMQDILREVIVPELEREVNEGVAFSGLRQVYYSLILGAWYRNKMKESVFSRVYVDQKKTEGIDHKESRMAEKIWKQYVESFRQGVFNFIREEKDPVIERAVPCKYISGGMKFAHIKTESASDIFADRGSPDYSMLRVDMVPEHRQETMIAGVKVDFDWQGRNGEMFGETKKVSRQEVIVQIQGLFRDERWMLGRVLIGNLGREDISPGDVEHILVKYDNTGSKKHVFKVIFTLTGGLQVISAMKVVCSDERQSDWQEIQLLSAFDWMKILPRLNGMSGRFFY